MTKEELKALSDQAFTSNGQGGITAADHRGFNDALIDSVALKGGGILVNISGWAGTFQLQLNEVNNYLPITTALSVGDNIMINGYITNWGGITTAFSSVIPMLAAGVVEGWYVYNDTPNGSTVELDDPLQAIAGRLTIRTYGISNETRITGIYLMPKV